MSLKPDDPRLTAYALGELDEADRREFESLLESSPDCQDLVREIVELGAELREELAGECVGALTTEQREGILRLGSDKSDKSDGPEEDAKIVRPAFWTRFSQVTGVVAVAACMTLLAAIGMKELMMPVTFTRPVAHAPVEEAEGTAGPAGALEAERTVAAAEVLADPAAATPGAPSSSGLGSADEEAADDLMAARRAPTGRIMREKSPDRDGFAAGPDSEPSLPARRGDAGGLGIAAAPAEAAETPMPRPIAPKPGPAVNGAGFDRKRTHLDPRQPAPMVAEGKAQSPLAPATAAPAAPSAPGGAGNAHYAKKAKTAMDTPAPAADAALLPRDKEIGAELASAATAKDAAKQLKQEMAGGRAEVRLAGRDQAGPFTLVSEVASCPWNESDRLVGLQLKVSDGTKLEDVRVEYVFAPWVKDSRTLETRGNAGVSTGGKADDKESGDDELLALLLQVTPRSVDAPGPPLLAKGKNRKIEDVGASRSRKMMAPDASSAGRSGREVLVVRARYRVPGESEVRTVELPVRDRAVSWREASPGFRQSAAIAGYSLMQKEAAGKVAVSADLLRELAGGVEAAASIEAAAAMEIDAARAARKVAPAAEAH